MCCRLGPGTLFLDLKLSPSKKTCLGCPQRIKKPFPMQCLSKRAKNWGQKNKLQQAPETHNRRSSLNVLIGGWKKIENRLSSAIFRGPRQCNKSEPSFSSTADALWRVTAPGRGRRGQCQLRCSDAPGLPCTQEQSRVMSVAH